MRIVGGKNKSRRIIAPKKLPVRPTTDMAKEALFNILNNRYYFDEISVLDLFAGIGSISFEFASRGTEQIISVDKNVGCIHFIQKTIDELDFDIQTVKRDSYQYLESCNQKFDVIFADPPYHFSSNQFEKIVELVFDKYLLENGGLLVVEHSSQTDLSKMPQFSFFKKYGGNIFSFFEN